MKCLNCGSKRIADIDAKCPDGFTVEIDGKAFDSPEIGTLCGGEIVEVKVCLDCGQCQGRWPVSFDTSQPCEFLEDTHSPNPEDCYDSLKKWEDAVKQHCCSSKEMLSCDIIESCHMGMICLGCGKSFFIRVTDAKKTIGEMSVGLQKSFVTTAGRRKLAKSYSVKQKGEKSHG
jgi:hypothetical protein